MSISLKKTEIKFDEFDNVNVVKIGDDISLMCKGNGGKVYVYSLDDIKSTIFNISSEFAKLKENETRDMLDTVFQFFDNLQSNCYSE
jgi:hypothetical protein